MKSIYAFAVGILMMTVLVPGTMAETASTADAAEDLAPAVADSDIPICVGQEDVAKVCGECPGFLTVWVLGSPIGIIRCLA